MYDPLDQILSATDASGNEISYSRDLNENIIKITRDNGTYTEITYNEDDCITSVVNMREYQGRFRCRNTETISTFSYEYDLSGLITKETSTGDGITTERIYAYDDRCQIIAVNEKITTTKCGKTLNVNIQDTFYTYDNAGNCIKEEVKRNSTTLYYTTYEYNAADQLLKKVLNVGSLKETTNYSYDENGNLVKENSSYNMSYTKACKCLKSLEGLTVTKGEITYKYDNENRLVATYENGKLIQAILYDGNGNRAYTLDKENVTSDSSVSSVYESKKFSFFGRKCSSSKNDSNSITYDKSLIKNELLKEYGISKFSAASYELTGYVTDLTQEYSQVLLEYGATGKVTNVYSYAEGRVSAIIDGRSYSYLNDGRGSVSELTMTSGSTAVSYRYGIYGKTLASNTCINNPYQYNAEYTDSTTGLQYLRARYYNADTHRFQTKDTYQGTTAQPITRNNYAYANNNPVNFVDPSGHVALAAIIAVATVAVVAITTPIVVKNAKQTVKNANATYDAQSQAIIEQLNDIERTQTRSGKTYGDTIWGAANRAWNKDHRSEFVDDAAYEQYVRLCDELEELQKDTKSDIWHANLNVAGIILDFADVANAVLYAVEGDYANAAESGLYMLPSAGGAVAGALKYSDEVADATKAARRTFKSAEKLQDHYDRHGKEIARVLNQSEYTVDDYLADANYIIENGTYTSELNGYVKFLGNDNYGFVGLDREKGNITTFHIKKVSELAKSAPSLGIQK